MNDYGILELLFKVVVAILLVWLIVYLVTSLA